jgi:hypothetical protein
MKIAVIIGGWYFPAHLYNTVIRADLPKNVEADYFVVSHRNPASVNISEEMLPRVQNNNKYDIELYSTISTYETLHQMGYSVREVPNLIGDYFFFNQWAEYTSYKDYEYVIFMHDDNYLLPEFKNIFVDIFEGRAEGAKYTHQGWQECTIGNFDYIANSAVGNRKTARGSFSVWSRKFLDAIGGTFPMEGVALTREGKADTPNGHLEIADWNMVGHNLQRFVEEKGYMETTYRLSKYYRISRYMIEGERGLISKTAVLAEDTKQGYAKYIR